MKTKHLLTALAAVSLSAFAQETPRTFTFKAPDAKTVEFRKLWDQPLPMTRDADGVWTVSTALAPGLYEYTFVVDGKNTRDAENPATRPAVSPYASVLEIPGATKQVWDVQEVPRGKIEKHSYESKALGRKREVSIYTPPGYDKDTTTNYPVLILLPAEGDSFETWTVWGKADRILDNLIAAGKAVPMIVLMPDGHPIGMAELKAKVEGKRDEAIAAFRKDLFDDALPLLAAKYRVKTDASNVAIAGMSCGFGQSLTLTTGLMNLDRIAWIGALAADKPVAELVQPALDDTAGTNAKMRLLYLPIGKQDFLLKGNQSFSEDLTKRGIKHEWELTEGGHSWAMYRGYLANFLGKIFREKSN